MSSSPSQNSSSPRKVFPVGIALEVSSIYQSIPCPKAQVVFSRRTSITYPAIQRRDPLMPPLSVVSLRIKTTGGLRWLWAIAVLVSQSIAASRSRFRSIRMQTWCIPLNSRVDQSNPFEAILAPGKNQADWICQVLHFWQHMIANQVLDPVKGFPLGAHQAGLSGRSDLHKPVRLKVRLLWIDAPMASTASAQRAVVLQPDHFRVQFFCAQSDIHMTDMATWTSMSFCFPTP